MDLDVDHLGYKAGRMNQNVMRSGLFCSSNNRSCGDFALRLIASCTQCTHEPLECLHSTGLLNKCTMFKVYTVYPSCNRYSSAQGTFSLSARPTKTYISAIICKSSCVSPSFSISLPDFASQIPSATTTCEAEGNNAKPPPWV